MLAFYSVFSFNVGDHFVISNSLILLFNIEIGDTSDGSTVTGAGFTKGLKRNRGFCQCANLLRSENGTI